MNNPSATRPQKTEPWMSQVAAAAEKIFHRHGVRLTLGGEPTMVPVNPSGAEWNYSAVGPEKLGFARRLAEELVATWLPDGTAFYSPGKQYPGEPNPRWALRILYSADRHIPAPAAVSKELPALTSLTRALNRHLALPSYWQRFVDPLHPEQEVRALLLDHEEEKGWVSHPWNLTPSQCALLTTEGPAGLRLPLQHLPEGVSRRALTLERAGDRIGLFFPPLLAEPFLALRDFFHGVLPAAGSTGSARVEYEGYLPLELPESLAVLGIASDPGVIEINLPPCASWEEYAWWIEVLDEAGHRAGLRAWRTDRGDFAGGTGGGNHLLFGSPKGEPNAFYERPAWVASFLSYWQKHPSLSYLFTGDYVGASSQAPRPDESGISLRELELALRDLRCTENPPTPYFLSENLRHLLVDSAGNPHRAEISLDKFHDPQHPAGLLGLIEFRAIESLPLPRWTNAVALLWTALAAFLLQRPCRRPLQDYGPQLHDRFFLPTLLWQDLQEVLRDCAAGGLGLEAGIFREIWEWKFPPLWTWEKGDARAVVRRAHESWPLLAEVPVAGGTTSRFVDSSLRRWEIQANAAFVRQHRLLFENRLLPLRKIGPDCWVAGLRYRHANLYPALHPRRPVQLPLHLSLLARSTNRRMGSWVLAEGQATFAAAHSPGPLPRNLQNIPALFPGAFTRDLRW
jgi:uncharacterized protein (DUF2126 family)